MGPKKITLFTGIGPSPRTFSIYDSTSNNGNSNSVPLPTAHHSGAPGSSPTQQQQQQQAISPTSCVVYPSPATSSSSCAAISQQKQHSPPCAAEAHQKWSTMNVKCVKQPWLSSTTIIRDEASLRAVYPEWMLDDMFVDDNDDQGDGLDGGQLCGDARELMLETETFEASRGALTTYFQYRNPANHNC